MEGTPLTKGLLRVRAWYWLVVLVAFGCSAVRLVSPYDATLDSGTSDVHTKVAAFVAKMKATSGKPQGTYEANADFYPQIAAEVSTLRMRADAQPKNEISVKLFDELAGNLERLRQLHASGKDGGLNALLADPAMNAIDVNCSSIIKFELAKKRDD